MFSMLMTDVFSKKESEKFIISHVGHVHVNRNYSAILATLQITSYALGV